MRLSLTVCLVALLSGCVSPPEIRLFEKQVPEAPEQSPEKVEAERQAAYYMASKLEQPVELKPLAYDLSTSLGVPEKSVDLEAPLLEESERLRALLRRGQVLTRRDYEQFQTALSRYEGKTIEGTGWNVTGPTGLLMVVGLIAFAVLVPGGFTFLWFIFKRVRNTGQQLVEGIMEFEKERPKEFGKMKSYLSRKMDKPAKQWVRKEKARLP